MLIWSTNQIWEFWHRRAAILFYISWQLQLSFHVRYVPGLISGNPRGINKSLQCLRQKANYVYNQLQDKRISYLFPAFLSYLLFVCFVFHQVHLSVAAFPNNPDWNVILHHFFQRRLRQKSDHYTTRAKLLLRRHIIPASLSRKTNVSGESSPWLAIRFENAGNQEHSIHFVTRQQSICYIPTMKRRSAKTQTCLCVDHSAL